MQSTDKTLTIHFPYSGKETAVTLKVLEDKSIEFLEHFATITLVGEEFCTILGDGPGSARFSRLLAASGHPENSTSFFEELLPQLTESNTMDKAINSVTLPYLFLVSLLEVILPGNGYISIQDVDHLQNATNLNVPKEQFTDLQKVIDTHPVRLSQHTIRQMMLSKDVAYQYMPFIEELDQVGHTNTWIGQFHQGLLEQMYKNRIIFLLHMGCPVYCRFCFRKHKESRNEQNPTVEAVNAAIEHVKKSPAIKEILVTGGDPFLSKNNMAATIDGLLAIEHVQNIRLATRSVSYYPDLFLKNESAYLTYLKQKNLELQLRGKRMEVATHFIHPDEVSPESLQIITELANSGITVYIQTPFLKNCNDHGPELKKLFGLLRGAGAELYYIFIPCSPIHGNRVYWSSLAEGIDIGKYLCAHLSDRSIPKICTATPIGKVEWFTSGWPTEPVAGKDGFVWIRTPYTLDYFKPFAPLAEKLTNIRVNEEGTLDIQYLAKMGDDRYFLGPRPRRLNPPPAPVEQPEQLQIESMQTTLKNQSIVHTGCDNLIRNHETRVEISTAVGHTDIDYIRNHKLISDVVITSHEDCIDELYVIGELIQQLQRIQHINSVRLQSLKFNYAPEKFTPAVVSRLGELNHLTVTNPLRLEIETWFVKADELKPEHGKITRRLNNKGITVYSNTPLLGRINDFPDEICNLTYGCRQAGIEFHHLYIAGLQLQQEWNMENPIDMYDVIDIASKIRREGSGREGPGYIIQTPIGQVHYGLTSSFFHDNDQLMMKINCFDLSYFQDMNSDFVFPENITIDNDGNVVMPIDGLTGAKDFPI